MDLLTWIKLHVICHNCRSHILTYTTPNQKKINERRIRENDYLQQQTNL